MSFDRQAPHASPPADSPVAGGDHRQAPATLESGALFRGATEVLIRHGLETYRLRQTQAGKLILTK